MTSYVRVALAAVFTAASLGLASPASSAGGPASWTVDKASSKLGFKSSFGGDAFEGAFRRWDAQIAFDPKALAASKVVVTVDMASASTGDESRDEALPTDDWFAAKSFPRATFTSKGFKDLGGGHYQAMGDLAIRGVAKPIVLPFTLQITGAQAKMTGQVSINRTVFGVGQGQFKSAETVPLDVVVNVSLQAHRAP